MALLDSIPSNRPYLQKLLSTYGDWPLPEYAQHLFSFKPQCALEPELLKAFQQTFEAQGCSPEQQQSYLHELQTHRILQTSTHLTATEGPSFFAIHALSLLGCPVEQTYFVGAYSGVPFSNSAWSGCLNYSSSLPLEALISKKSAHFQRLQKAQNDRQRDSNDARISLISGKQRDGLVYRSAMPQSLDAFYQDWNPALQQHSPSTDDTFAQWALKYCEALTQACFQRQSIVFLDLNEVIRQYLENVLSSSDHPMTRFLSDDTWHTQDWPLFIEPIQHKNKERCSFISTYSNDIHTLQQDLASKRLCPSAFLVFGVLAFLNGFRCLGSFDQIEYLPQHQDAWRQLSMFDQDTIETADTQGWTSGRMLNIHGQEVYPLNWHLEHSGTSILDSEEWDAHQSISQFMTPILKRWC